MREMSKKMVLLCLGVFLMLIPGISVQAKEKNPDDRPDYAIYVNREENCVTVMEQKADGTSVVAKVMVCSCGKAGNDTPEGTFRTSDYYDWRLLVDGSYGKYAVRFNNKILFHSVPYEQAAADTLEWEQYNLLGENASLGCVRLSVSDAKWIYDNCKVGTPVTVYSGTEIVGGVTKPVASKIAADSSCRGWDPTDITANNPWHKSETAGASQEGSFETFNYIAYADKYADVREAFGYDKAALYNHYFNLGKNEGRIAEFY